MQPIFFYDRDCGFCEWASEKLDGLTDGLAIKPATLGEHAIYQDDQDHLGHRAIGKALAKHARTAPVRLSGEVLLFRPLGPVWAGIYRLVAINRHRLGPLVGKDSCSI